MLAKCGEPLVLAFAMDSSLFLRRSACRRMAANGLGIILFRFADWLHATGYSLHTVARQLAWDGELHTYCTLFGLLACTGLRISEALDLRRDEVDLKQGILTIKESKRRRFRLVPLHPSA